VDVKAGAMPMNGEEPTRDTRADLADTRISPHAGATDVAVTQSTAAPNAATAAQQAVDEMAESRETAGRAVAQEDTSVMRTNDGGSQQVARDDVRGGGAPQVPAAASARRH
jgi:hypothetical protein